MKKFTKEELKEILENHKLWLKNENVGVKSSLTRADLSRANLAGADLSDVNLSRANLAWSNLTKADLTRANLTRAVLSGANLYKANLTGSDLTEADLSRVVLIGAVLTGADLTGADLTNAVLTEVISNSGIKIYCFQKHTAFYLRKNEISIGCEVHSLEYWLNNYRMVGRDNNYTSEQIEKYGSFIKECNEDFLNRKK